jgi:hypothetical protein
MYLDGRCSRAGLSASNARNLACALTFGPTTGYYDVYDTETILKFLHDHIGKSGDDQARVKWQPNIVVLWDNGVTARVRTKYVLFCHSY